MSSCCQEAYIQLAMPAQRSVQTLPKRAKRSVSLVKQVSRSATGYYLYDSHYHHHRHHPHVHDFCVNGFRVASTVLAASAAISYNFTSTVKALMQQRHQRQQCRWQQGSQQQQRASENLARCWSACALILSCPKSAFNIGVQRLR